MKDGYGRSIDYLRISLTDKCNLRCRYCMPADGIRHLAHSEILTLEEIVRIVKIMSHLGIKSVRLTGGEPLVRKGVVSLVEMLVNDCRLSRTAMTTNGSLLKEYAVPLREAGLSEVNISLDSLNDETFRKLTGSGSISDVTDGIEAAVKAGLEVKLNCVPVIGMNDGEILSVARYAEGLGVPLRFIELMPIGCGAGFEGVSTDEIMRTLEEEYGRALPEMTQEAAPGGPAMYYSFEAYNGRIGFISPLSHRFCENCNRLRLTSEGFLKLCLQYPDGVDLMTPIRSGASDLEIAGLIQEAVMHKKAAHSFGHMKEGTDDRKMVEIGG